MDPQTRTNLCASNVTCWEGRPRRATKRTRTYWEEYVEQDTWYQKELVRDVPEEEMEAACFDEDFSHDEGEEGEEEEAAEAAEADPDPEFLLTEESEDDESSSSDEGSGTDSEGESGETSSDAGSDGLASGTESESESDYSPRTPPGSPESPCHFVPAGSPVSPLKTHRGPSAVPPSPQYSPCSYTPTRCRTPTKED